VLATTNPPSAGRIVKSQACCFVIAVVLGVSVRIARDVHVEENNPLSQSAGPIGGTRWPSRWFALSAHQLSRSST
jgi:hypothetical protein